MSESENTFLQRFLPQRFLPQREPQRPPASVATIRARQQAAAVATNLVAREAVAALHLLEQSFQGSGPGAESELGVLFGELWDRSGLGELDWTDPERGDAERILAAAAGLANDPSGELALDEAWVRAGSDGNPVVERAEDIRKDMDRAYSTSSLARDPAGWLQQSLRRLANARVLEDVAGEHTTVQVPKETMRLGEDLIRQTQRLAGDRRAVDRAAVAVDEAVDGYDTAMTTTVGFWAGSAIGAAMSEAPLPVRAVMMTPGVYLTVRAYAKDKDLDRAQHAYDSRAQRVSASRDAVVDTLDRVPQSGQPRPGARPSVLDRFRRDGGSQGR